MTFTQELIDLLSDKFLLKHEFYQKWNSGEIPIESLQLYAKQYFNHVEAFPRYVSATHSNCKFLAARQVLLDNLIDEEKGAENHPELWIRFAEGIGVKREEMGRSELMEEIKNLVDSFLGFAKSSYAEGLGALLAYEYQVPQVAEFKIKALKQHYDISDSRTLQFFDVHQKADVYHTDALRSLLDNLSPEEKKLSSKAAKVTADNLWKFLDGIYKTVHA